MRMNYTLLRPARRNCRKVSATIVKATSEDDNMHKVSSLLHCFLWWRVAVLLYLERKKLVLKSQLGNSVIDLSQQQEVSGWFFQWPSRYQVSWHCFVQSKYSQWVRLMATYRPYPAGLLEGHWLKCDKLLHMTKWKGGFIATAGLWSLDYFLLSLLYKTI